MKADVSIVSFGLVLVIAIPVTALRSQTYSVGYEIADLKAKERNLREQNLALKAKLGEVEAGLLSRPPIETQEGTWVYPGLDRIGILSEGTK